MGGGWEAKLLLYKSIMKIVSAVCSLINAIKGCITKLVRNAFSHGVRDRTILQLCVAFFKFNNLVKCGIGESLYRLVLNFGCLYTAVSLLVFPLLVFTGIDGSAIQNQFYSCLCFTTLVAKQRDVFGVCPSSEGHW